MGRRGPPPKPTRLKIAGGNPGKRPLNPDEPQPSVVVPTCPEWLPARAKDEWQRITPELQRLGLVSLIDQAALSGYCVAVAELEDATATLEKAGRVCEWPIFDRNGIEIGVRLKPHPAVAMQRSAAALVRAFMAEFGLSPAARSRVTVKGQDKADGRGKKFFGTAG